MSDWRNSDCGLIWETIGADETTSRGTAATGGNANTKGSYTQLVAATARDASRIQVSLMTAVIEEALADIAVGASGSEKIILADLLLGGMTATGSRVANYNLPCSIPAGSRISARCQTALTTGKNVRAICRLGSPAFGSEPTGGRVATYGANSGATRGTQVDPGGTIHTKGAWSELVASCDEVVGFQLACGVIGNTAMAGYNWLLDVGVGAAGSEQVILSDMLVASYAAGNTIYPLVSPFIVRRIPAGSRISVRAQCSGTDATDRLFDAVMYAAVA